MLNSTPLKRTSILIRSGIKKRARKRAKAAESLHMAKVASSCCVVCRNEGLGETPAEVHHVRFSAGAGQRSSNWDVLPLCHAHHRTGGYGIAFHAGAEIWEKRYGTEESLLAQVKDETGLLESA